MIITLEGNIGAGKSVFAEFLSDFLKHRGYRVKHVKEPLDLWNDFYGHNLFQMYYSNKARWAFAFQVNALQNMLMNEMEAVYDSFQGNIVILERSSFAVRNFFTPVLSQLVLDPVETKIIENLNEVTVNPIQQCNRNLIIYMQTDPDTCLERLVRRGRPDEIGNVDLDYLNRLHLVHEDVLVKENFNDLLYVDGRSFDEGCVEKAKIKGTDVFAVDRILDYILSEPIPSTSGTSPMRDRCDKIRDDSDKKIILSD